MSAFESQPPKLSTTTDPYISYPKYLPKYKLLPLQTQDPKFCISFMLQLLVLFESFAKPVSQVQKKYFMLGDAEKRTIEQVAERIYTIFGKIKANTVSGQFEDCVKHILARESAVWAIWKEAKSCSPFELQAGEETLHKFEEARMKVTRKMEKGLPQKLDISFRKVSKSKADQLSLFGSTSASDFSEILATPVTVGIPEDLQVPTMGELLDRVYNDLDPAQAIEKEYKAKNNPVSILNADSQ